MPRTGNSASVGRQSSLRRGANQRQGSGRRLYGVRRLQMAAELLRHGVFLDKDRAPRRASAWAFLLDGTEHGSFLWGGDPVRFLCRDRDDCRGFAFRQRVPVMKSNTSRPASRAGNRAVAGKRANSTSIAAVEGPLSRLIGEKGTELKTPRAAIPM